MASKLKKRHSPDDDDGGGDDSTVIANGSDEDISRPTKKIRTGKSSNALPDASSSLSRSKRSASSAGSGGSYKTDSNGDPYWEISRLRRVTVSSFKGKTMVNVREYYEKDGLELPGKKGISMPVEQFSAIAKLLPDIEDAIKKKGEILARPDYWNKSGNGGEKSGMRSVSSDHDGDRGDNTRNSARSSRTGAPSRKNIEATSDEDEGDE